MASPLLHRLWLPPEPDSEIDRLRGGVDMPPPVDEPLDDSKLPPPPAIEFGRECLSTDDSSMLNDILCAPVRRLRKLVAEMLVEPLCCDTLGALVEAR